VKKEIETGFMVDRDYTVTATVYTEYGNMSSSANFSKFNTYEYASDRTKYSYY